MMFLAKIMLGCIVLGSLLLVRSARHPSFQHNDKHDRTAGFVTISHQQQKRWDRSKYCKQKIINQPAPLYYSTNTNSSGHLLRVNGVSSKNGYYNHNHHRTSHTAAAATGQSVDRLRVDLMRTKLSVKTAEDRAKRMETELKEMKRKYDVVRRALREERRAHSGSISLAGQQKEAKQSQIVQTVQQEKMKEGQKPGPVTNQTQEVYPITVQSDSTTAPSFASNSDLPPMAAALFANAEREERNKRMRRMGMIEKADIVDDASSVRAENETGRVSVGGNTVATSAVPGMAETNMADAGAGTNSTKLITTESNGSENRYESSMLLINDANNATAIRNSSISGKSLTIHEKSHNEQLEKLLKKCATLTHQKLLLERKLTQKTELSHARTLAQAEAAMEAKKTEWNEMVQMERDKWNEERNGLELQMKSLTEEKDCLVVQLDNLESVTHLVKLLCSLIWDRFVEILSRCFNRRSPPSTHEDRMLAVGGGDRRPAKYENQNGINSLGSLGRLFLQLFKDSKGLGLEEEDAHSQPQQHGNTLALDPTKPERKTMTASIAGTTSSPPSSPVLKNDMPLLVRKKKRRPRLYHPNPLLVSAKARREAGASSSSYVPKFLRKEG